MKLGKKVCKRGKFLFRVFWSKGKIPIWLKCINGFSILSRWLMNCRIANVKYSSLFKNRMIIINHSIVELWINFFFLLNFCSLVIIRRMLESCCSIQFKIPLLWKKKYKIVSNYFSLFFLYLSISLYFTL